jgi:hypothetical protein
VPGPNGFGLSFSLFKNLIWVFILFCHLCTASALQWRSSCLDLEDSPHGTHTNQFHFIPAVRWGEALHPGPSEDWRLFGFSNTSGLRQ